MADTSSSRRLDLDFLRVLAIFSVIIIHCEMPLMIVLLPSDPAWIIADVLDSYMRWSVPVFIAISGALLIRPATYRDIGGFFRRRASRILIPLLAWPLLYWLWDIVFRTRPASPREFIDGLLVGNPVGGYQLYFLFIIAGLYVIAPLLSAYAHHVSARAFLLSTALVFIAAYMWLALVNILPGQSESYTFLTAWLPYTGFFMLGHVLRDFRPTNRQFRLALAGILVAGLFNALITVFTRAFDSMFFLSYFSVSIVILSIGAFVAGRELYYRIVRPLSDTARSKFDQNIAYLAHLSFGVYLVHVMVLESIVRFAHLSKFTLSTAIILAILVPPLSFSIVALMIRLPIAKRLVS